MTVLTPGTYIRLRREAARITLHDVALLLDSDPHVPALRRIGWLAAIEADREPVTETIALALVEVLPIDFMALARLVAVRAGVGGVEAPSLCTACGAGPVPGCDAKIIADLLNLPAQQTELTREAMLAACGQPDTIGGTMIAATIAAQAGWMPGIDGLWHRAVIFAEQRA